MNLLGDHERFDGGHFAVHGWVLFDEDIPLNKHQTKRQRNILPMNDKHLDIFLVVNGEEGVNLSFEELQINRFIIFKVSE